MAAAIALRRSSSLDLTSFRQNHIRRQRPSRPEKHSRLQTPFDRGWGLTRMARQPPRESDIGLLGVALDAGEHKVELRYRTPFLRTAFAVTALALDSRLRRVALPRMHLPTRTIIPPSYSAAPAYLSLRNDSSRISDRARLRSNHEQIERASSRTSKVFQAQTSHRK